MRIKVETLRHELDVFMWENPEWSDAQIVINKSTITARKAIRRERLGPQPFNIQFEEKVIYDGTVR